MDYLPQQHRDNSKKTYQAQLPWRSFALTSASKGKDKGAYT